MPTQETQQNGVMESRDMGSFPHLVKQWDSQGDLHEEMTRPAAGEEAGRPVSVARDRPGIQETDGRISLRGKQEEMQV